MSDDRNHYGIKGSPVKDNTLDSIDAPFMRFFLDCEWNGYKGRLISIALVPDVGPIFYGVLGCMKPEPWVAEHVMPVLGVPPSAYVSLQDLQAQLQGYFGTLERALIVTDWPEDVARFCDLLITGPGTRIECPELAFHVDRVAGDAAVSKIPHNAVEDAIALQAAVWTK